VTPTDDVDVDDGADWSAIPMEPAAAFTAISNSRRRTVILSVDRAREAIAARDVAEQIAAIEDGILPDEVSGQARTNVYVTLTQGHLPTLDELGAIEYDERSKQILSTSATQPLAHVIKSIQASCYKADDVNGEDDAGNGGDD